MDDGRFDPDGLTADGLIEIAEDGVYITDTGSTNGTMLNDAKLSPNMRTTMTPDDVIRLGSLEFRVQVKGKAYWVRKPDSEIFRSGRLG